MSDLHVKVVAHTWNTFPPPPPSTFQIKGDGTILNVALHTHPNGCPNGCNTPLIVFPTERMSLQQICHVLLPGEVQSLDGEVQGLEVFFLPVSQQGNCCHMNETHLRDGSVLNCCRRSNLSSFIALKCYSLSCWVLLQIQTKLLWLPKLCNNISWCSLWDHFP